MGIISSVIVKRKGHDCQGAYAKGAIDEDQSEQDE